MSRINYFALLAKFKFKQAKKSKREKNERRME